MRYGLYLNWATDWRNAEYEAVAKDLTHLYRRAARHRHGLFRRTSHPFQKQHIGAYIQPSKGQAEKPCLLFFGNGGLLYCGGRFADGGNLPRQLLLFPLCRFLLRADARG